MAPWVKRPPADAGDIRDPGSISGLGRPSGEGRGNPLQYSCLGNPMDKRTWRATVHRLTKSQTRPTLIYLAAPGSQLWHTGSPVFIAACTTFSCSMRMGSSSLTRDLTQAPPPPHPA